MFERENDSDWSQYKLAGSDIIDIIYLGVPPGVGPYVSKTTTAISNDRTRSGTKQVSKTQVTHLIETGSMSNKWTARVFPFLSNQFRYSSIVEIFIIWVIKEWI
jgi:hypothetical protein